jgi:hypothetical protein
VEFQASMSILKEQKSLNDYRRSLSGGYNRPGGNDRPGGGDNKAGGKGGPPVK